MASNFERMIQLAGEVFAAHNDPTQLDVDEEVMEKLERLHPATLSDYDEGAGPVVWILLIPTTISLMNQFIRGEISETELLNNTPVNIKYEAIYLCSALVLPEYRHKGLATKVGLDAIHQIRANNPIEYLFTWSFSKEGASLAQLAAKTEGLKLLERPARIKE
jgi:hypothetical protein